MIIQMRDSLGARYPNINEVFSAPNDTDAFMSATNRFGLYKSLQRKQNRLKGRNSPEPFDFEIVDKDSSAIAFPPKVTKRLTGQEVKYWDAKLKEADRTMPEPPKGQNRCR